MKYDFRAYIRLSVGGVLEYTVRNSHSPIWAGSGFAQWFTHQPLKPGETTFSYLSDALKIVKVEKQNSLQGMLGAEDQKAHYKQWYNITPRSSCDYIAGVFS